MGIQSVIKITCPNCKETFPYLMEGKPKRTLRQNNLYWGVYVSTIADALGYFPDECHEELKILFNPKDSKIRLGQKIGGTTTKMTTSEFTQYLEKIRIWAMTEHGIDLPETGQEACVSTPVERG